MPWTEAGDLAGFDLVLPLVAWGYHLRFARAGSRLLDRLERERLPIDQPARAAALEQRQGLSRGAWRRRASRRLPTLAVEALDEADLDEARARVRTTELVVKPPVSASADGTLPARPGRSDSRRACAAGAMMVQPFMRAIADEGEYSLMLFDGEFSHAVVKRPKAGDFRVQPHLGGSERAVRPPPEARSSLPRPRSPRRRRAATYARVDMVADDDGELRIMELELIEPALFLDMRPTAARHSPPRSLAASAREQPLADRRGQVGRLLARRAARRRSRATSALTGQPRSRAAASSARQNIGSRLIEVSCPAISTDRLSGGA